MTVIKSAQVARITQFASAQGMVPLVGLVVCLADEQLIHCWLLRADQMDSIAPKVQHGYSIDFKTSEVSKLAGHGGVQYFSCRVPFGIDGESDNDA